LLTLAQLVHPRCLLAQQLELVTPLGLVGVDRQRRFRVGGGPLVVRGARLAAKETAQEAHGASVSMCGMLEA
jgi:hypothetical protein